MAKVFITHQKNHDLSSAEKYGEFTILTSGKVSIFKTDDLANTVREKLSTATSDDFLLLSGSPIINCIAFSYLLSKFAVVNVLIFNAITREYVCRTISEHLIMGGNQC